jgi:outer membrane protein assembly factor BamE (lipoprotein component of BamABCDE complex)
MGLQLDLPNMGRNKKTRQSSGPRRVLARRRGLRRTALCCLLIASSALSACSEQITKHGHQFRETDLAQVTPGMGQDQVKLVLGSPTTTSTYATGSAYYYISSTETQASFMKPTEVDRQVMAIYFTPTGTVERVANYGMKDGKVFDFVSRTTPAPGGKDDGILKQLFRNLGSKQIFGE